MTNEPNPDYVPAEPVISMWDPENGHRLLKGEDAKNIMCNSKGEPFVFPVIYMRAECIVCKEIIEGCGPEHATEGGFKHKFCLNSARIQSPRIQ